ncbi:MAG: hypothetical protein AB1513_07905 [Pseudomonadota bacterium]
MDIQNLAYALTQVAHNFGAVAVTGGAIAALYGTEQTQRRLAWLVLAGWSAQAASGAAFGAVSYYYYSQFPDIHGIAAAALAVKMICAATGFVLAALCTRQRRNKKGCRNAWRSLAALAVTALTAAAFLRWFS